MRTAVVEAASVVFKPSVTVRTADGKATTCSSDHLWLVRPMKQPHRGPRIRWMKAEDLRPGDALLSLGTWAEANSRAAGYLAGLYDGEESIQSRGLGHRATGLTFAQLRGPVMDEFCAAMDALASIMGKVRALTNGSQHKTLANLLHQLNPVLRGWCNYFRHGASAATFRYLDLFAWRRVTGWLRKRHPGITWKRLFRRFLTKSPGHRPAEGKEILFLAQQVPIVRYRWRATNIPTPWANTRTAETA